MNLDLLWRRIGANEQKVAEAEHLIVPGENYRLTASQEQALAQLDGWFRGGARAALLQAPTGAGKTAVEFRLVVSEFLARQAPWCLSRAHAATCCASTWPTSGRGSPARRCVSRSCTAAWLRATARGSWPPSPRASCQS